MKTHIRRFISLFLSAVLIVSSLSMSFEAIADEIQNSKNENVTNVETLIKDFYDNHKSNLYSSKADLKAEARAKFDEVSSALSKLSKSEKQDLNLAYYAYWLQMVQTDVIRLATNKVPSTDQKIDLVMNELDSIEAVCGEIPNDYKEAISKLEPVKRKNGSTYLLSNKTDFKKSDDAQSALKDLINNIATLSLSQLEFLDYVAINSTGGYYFNQTNLNEKTVSSTVSALLSLIYYESQDLNASGSDPKSWSYSSYVKRTGSASAGYTYAWASGKDAQKYIDDFATYESAYQANVIDCGIDTVSKILEMTDSISYLNNLSLAVNSVKNVGVKLLKGESATVDEIKTALSLQQNLSDYEQKVFSTISSSSYCKVLQISSNIYTDASELTPEIAYTKSSKLSYYNINNCLTELNNKIYDLMFDDFNTYVENVNLSKLDDDIVSIAMAKYVDLPSNYKSKITNETMSKYMQIVKPEANHDDFSEAIEAYKMTEIVRPSDSRVAWTVGGIQSVVDKIWFDVGYVGNIAAPQLNLKNGLDTVLEDNLYTNEMVSKIIDLYATLSRNELDLGVMNLTLGKVIKMLCSNSSLLAALEEDKYDKAKEKIREFKDFKETDEENMLEALSKVQFVSGDFGFEDGDRDGFIDALLAILRPITNLLAPGAKALGLVALNINMFDYINDDGQYVNGVYSNLIPALETAGLTNVPNESDYKANYYKVLDEKGKNIAADEFLRPLLDVLCTQFIDEVSPDPLNGLIKYLPSISYVIGTDMLNNCVKSALAQAGMLSGLASSLDLSSEWITHKLTDNPLNINGVNIQLKEIDWLKLANCATVSSVKSKSNENDYLMLRTGETDTCFTTLFYYLYDVLFANEENYAGVKTLLTSLLGSSVSDLIVSLTDKLVGYGNVKAYSRVLYWLGTSGSELIDSPDNPFIEKEKPTTKPTTQPTTAPVTEPTSTVTEPATQPSSTETPTTTPVESTTSESTTQPTTVPATTESPVVTTTQPATVATTQATTEATTTTVAVPTTAQTVVTTTQKSTTTKAPEKISKKQKKANIKKATPAKASATISWAKVKGVKGYEVQLATDKKFKKNVKSKTIKKQKTTKTTVKNLKSKTKYYVRIRTYKMNKGTKVYSTWSKVKTVKTK